MTRLRAVVTSEWTLLAAIAIAAAVLRFWRLGSVPLGLHGDEAWTGIDARRVLDEGWIGPYLLSALGQPIGPVYWTAFVFGYLPESTFSLRLSMALFGAATVPLAYTTFRLMFDRTIAAFAALLLAVMMWHLHLSRTAFMVQVQPFVQLAVLFALFHALRRQSLPLFALAGLLAGAGVYAYNSYLLFLPVPLVAIAWHFAPHVRDGNRLGFGIIAASVCVTAAVFISLPMIAYINEHFADWRLHQEVVNLTDQDAWHDASIAGKAELIGERAWEWQRGLIWGDREDLGDGLATTGHPPIEPAVYGLALIGLVVAVWNWRRAEHAVVLASVALLPWGALLTIEDGLFRRTLGLAPFIAVLAAFPLAWLWRQVARREAGVRRAAMFAAVLAIPAFAAVKTTYDYFVPVQNTFAMTYVFPYQMDAASRYVGSLPAGTLVYFYSERWPFDYETRIFFAPEATGIDRSLEYGSPAEALNFEADRSRDVAFVFLDAYLPEFEQAAGAHPDGVVTSQVRNGERLFIGYFLPAQP